MSRDTQTLATLTRARFDPQRTRAASQHIGLGLGLGLGFGIRLGLRLGLGVGLRLGLVAAAPQQLLRLGRGQRRSSTATTGRARARRAAGRRLPAGREQRVQHAEQQRRRLG